MKKSLLKLMVVGVALLSMTGCTAALAALGPELLNMLLNLIIGAVVGGVSQGTSG